MQIDQIKNLYINGESVPSIAKKFHCSPWVIYNLMKKHNIPRRKHSESNYINFINKPLTYSLKKELDENEKILKYAGLIIYWAEGSKKGKGTVDLANSDPEMIKIFITFLRRIYNVSELKIRVLLYCYSNQNINKLIEYWSKIADIPRNQFSKPYVRKDFSNNQIGKMPYGLIHIRYSDTKLQTQIKNDIVSIKNNLLGYLSGQQGLTVK